MTMENAFAHNGDGAATRNQLTIARPITSFPIIPAILPSNVPQPARPALTSRFPQ